MSDPLWYKRAACLNVDPDTFYPERGAKGPTIERAKRVCRACPVLADCREEVMAMVPNQDAYGIRAGMTETERRRLRRRAA